MEELFCENCGAPIDADAMGDGDLQIIVCAECGHENSIASEEEEPAGEYNCPHCGAVLDYQYGFEPEDAEWVCRQCGKLISDNKYYCPHCNSLLNEQCGFTPAAADWSCAECGKSIAADKVYCPHCNALLSEQEGFDPDDSDFVCRECGMAVSEEAVPDEEEDTAGEVPEYRRPSRNIQHSRERIVRLKLVRRIYALLVIAVILSAVFIAVRVRLDSMIPAGYDAMDFVGMTYNEAVDLLKEQGFKNVTAKAYPDLDNIGNAADHTVKQVKIDGVSGFRDVKMFPDSSSAVVIYHSLKEITVPMSSYDAGKNNADYVLAAFRNAGFINITSEADADLITGWIHKDGQVESVNINGSIEFDSDEKYRPDTEIVITYHTFRNKKTAPEQ